MLNKHDNNLAIKNNKLLKVITSTLKRIRFDTSVLKSIKNNSDNRS